MLHSNRILSPQTEKIEDDVDDVNAKIYIPSFRVVGDFAPPALPDAVTIVTFIMDKEKEYVRTTINRNETIPQQAALGRSWGK